MKQREIKFRAWDKKKKKMGKVMLGEWTTPKLGYFYLTIHNLFDNIKVWKQKYVQNVKKLNL